MKNCRNPRQDQGNARGEKGGAEPVWRVMAEAGTCAECEENVNAIIAAMEKSGHPIEVKKYCTGVVDFLPQSR